MKEKAMPKCKGSLKLKVKGDPSKTKHQTAETVIIIIVAGIAIAIISMILAIVFIGVVVFGICGGIG